MLSDMMMKSAFLSFGILVLLCVSGCVQEEKAPGLPRDLEIIVSGGQLHASETDVSLMLFARDAAECRLSNDNQNWGAWETYSRNAQWTLSEGDGPKQVYFQCRNSMGELSVPVAATITLDSTAPLMDIETPADMQRYVDRFNLVFTAIDSVSQSIVCSAKLDDNPMEIGVVTSGRKQNISIMASEGPHTLSLECSDGMFDSVRTVDFEIVKAPIVALVINDGSGYTDSSDVTLNLKSASASECRFSNKDAEWSEWLPYSATVNWTLISKEGKRTVNAECRNSEGIVSAMVSDTITLDTSPPPYISLSVNNGMSWTNSRDVTLGLYAFAASECRFSNDGDNWSAWESYKRKKAWTLSEGEGEKTVYYNCRKKSGEDIGTVNSVIAYSKVPIEPPSLMSIQINGGGQYTASEAVPLTLSALGAYQCRYREGTLDWSQWEEYTTHSTFELSTGDGAKTIYYQCRNDYGSTTVFSRIYLDLTPPGKPTNLIARASPYAVNLYWAAAKDVGSGVKLYQIFRKPSNGEKVWAGITSGLNFKDELVVPGETYTYTVMAVDMNNNYGNESDAVSVSIPSEE